MVVNTFANHFAKLVLGVPDEGIKHQLGRWIGVNPKIRPWSSFSPPNVECGDSSPLSEPCGDESPHSPNSPIGLDDDQG
ncbi:MAG: hypothetical protein DM484_20740 [Candidatus Methylumidiphilus alinenensis]|uniref:Uncharacterized protein n=1 Tax=Candidatus Methylumidiphilus alinenensis TaxID=2202197 RepID=A0A2W4QU93_9GAMM|nr:MAG: hypothetical protein DM484_20740 [Candidatus Methylumidiphilus alinenensis]